MQQREVIFCVFRLKNKKVLRCLKAPLRFSGHFLCWTIFILGSGFLHTIYSNHSEKSILCNLSWCLKRCLRTPKFSRREKWLLFARGGQLYACYEVFFSTFRSISASPLTSLQGYGTAIFSRPRKPPSAIIFVFGGSASRMPQVLTHTTSLTAAETGPRTNAIRPVIVFVPRYLKTDVSR